MLSPMRRWLAECVAKGVMHESGGGLEGTVSAEEAEGAVLKRLRGE